MSQEKGPEAYTARLTECQSLADLRELMTLYGDLAVDAGRTVAKMTEADWPEFKRGLKSERKGRFAGQPWADRFISILMPLPMFRIAVIAEEYKAPFSVTWRRLQEVRPDLLEVPE